MSPSDLIEKNLSKMTQPKQKMNDDFFSKVYEVTKLIPLGRITSYGAIARYLGSGRSARMVGWALNASHSNREFIPAHRVVNRNGLLTGKRHFGNSTTKEKHIENEYFIIENDRIINFKERFWDPGTELK